MIMSEELLHCVYLNYPSQGTGVLQGYVYVSSFWSSSHDVLDDPGLIQWLLTLQHYLLLDPLERGSPMMETLPGSNGVTVGGGDKWNTGVWKLLLR